MTSSYIANEQYQGRDGTVVLVTGQTQYRVRFADGEAEVTAPGLFRTVELDEDIYPEDDAERAALIIVAQLEGGVDI